MEYRYGMRLRGFSPGCQPKEGLLRREDDTSGEYYDILVYDRKLDQDEIRSYELDDLGKQEKYPKEVTETLFEIDESFRVDDLTPDEVFDCICDYEGLIGYGSKIRTWVRNIYGVDLSKIGGTKS